MGKVVFIWAGLVAGNASYAILASKGFAHAAEISFFQLWALLSVWFVEKWGPYKS